MNDDGRMAIDRTPAELLLAGERLTLAQVADLTKLLAAAVATLTE